MVWGGLEENKSSAYWEREKEKKKRKKEKEKRKEKEG